MKIYLPLIILCYTSHVFGQNFATDDPDYKVNVQLGEQALKAEKYDSCVLYYQRAFEIRQTSYLSTMRAAACAFSSGDIDHMASQLDTAFAINWSGAKQIFDDYAEFRYLDGTPFEERVEQRFQNAAKELGIDLLLMAELEKIRYEDQRYRQAMTAVEEKYGWQSPQMDSLWVLQNKADSFNTARISKIIEERGYPGRSLVGDAQASTAFLVVQHADQEVQEKYLPVIVAAADAGEVSWSSVALLIDRVNLKQGKPQIYGSQVGRDEDTGEHYFLEIEQPQKVDSIRNAIGMSPLQTYAEHFEFSWDPDAHVERIKTIKAREAAVKKE